MADTDLIDVKYTANADPRDSNGAIVGLPGRDDILLGGVGQVTSREFGVLSARGLLLEPLTKAKVKQETTAPTNHDHGGGLVHEHSRDFSSMGEAELQGLVEEHEITVTGTGKDKTATKKDLEDALATAHA